MPGNPSVGCDEDNYLEFFNSTSISSSYSIGKYCGNVMPPHMLGIYRISMMYKFEGSPAAASFSIKFTPGELRFRLARRLIIASYDRFISFAVKYYVRESIGSSSTGTTYYIYEPSNTPAGFTPARRHKIVRAAYYSRYSFLVMPQFFTVQLLYGYPSDNDRK